MSKKEVEVREVIAERLGYPEDNLAYVCNQIDFSKDAIIEASAGTGKTYTLQSIVLKLLWRGEHNERTPIVSSVKNLLLVTFTEKAAGELRDRIRDVLEKAGCLPPDFEEVSICTIHSFCRELLTEYAFENHVPMEAEIGGSDKQLIHESVLEALHSEEYRTIQGRKFVELMKAVKASDAKWDSDKLVAEAVKDFGRTDPLPETVEKGKKKEIVADSKAILLNALRPIAQGLFRRGKDAISVMSFDDLVDRAHEVIVKEARLEREEAGYRSELLDSIRHKYRIALVDEFQDTDKKQWDIFRSIFSSRVNNLEDGPAPNRGCLLVVGDPKQAIYSFRGADIAVYLEAKNEITAGDDEKIRTLDTTCRSSPELVDAFNAIFGKKIEPDQAWFEGMTEGSGSISYRDVKSADKSKKFNEIAPKFGAAVELLESLPGPQKDPAYPTSGYGNKTRCLSVFLSNAAKEMRRLLSLRPAYTTVDPETKETIEHTFTYRDMCILVRGHADAAKAQEVLTAEGIPFSVYKEQGIYASAEAESLLALFDFLSLPSRRGRLEALLLTPLFGYRPDQLEARLKQEDHEFTNLLDGWQELIVKKEWSKFFERVMNDTQLAHPRKDDPDFDRRWTATRQILDRLLEEVGRRAQTVDEFSDALRAWRQNDQRAGENGALRRKESEADCVQIMTMHVSKGLEFPVVFVAWGFGPLGRKGETKENNEKLIREEKRLLYVALTRAEHKLFLPWSQWSQHQRISATTDKKTKEKKETFSEETGIGSVGSALLIKKGDTNPNFGFLASGIRACFGGDDESKAVVIRTAERLKAFERDSKPKDESTPAGDVAVVPPIKVYKLDNDELQRQRLENDSYSSVHKRAKQIVEPVGGVTTVDENHKEIPSWKREPTLLPRSNISGDVFHEIMETLCNNDDSDGRLPGFCSVGQATFEEAVNGRDDRCPSDGEQNKAHWSPLMQLIGKVMRKHQIASQKNADGDTTERVLARMAWRALNVPIEIGGRVLKLKDVKASDRRAEMEFVVNRALMLGDARTPEEDPQRDNAFNGKIDLLIRPDGKEGPVYVLDWKTNSLPDFATDTLERSMTASDYHLQYRFYTQAVRTWLGGAELGGVAYLFVRAGEKSEKPEGETGVFVAKAENITQESCREAIKSALT